MIRNLLRFFNRRPVKRIDDLGRATATIDEALKMIEPEKRFKALKIAAEQNFPTHRLYKFHPCNRKKVVT